MSSTSRASYLAGQTCFWFGKMGKERTYVFCGTNMFQNGGKLKKKHEKISNLLEHVACINGV
jgi:hypothetical protein